MSGLDQNTGQLMSPDAHLAQSISDILSTPIGSRLMRRDYGSDLPRLIDAPMNGETMVDLFQATAEAIDRWEPRFVLQRVEINKAEAGFVDMSLSGDVDHRTIQIPVAIGVAA